MCSSKGERCTVGHSAMFLSLGGEIIREKRQNKVILGNVIDLLSHSTVSIAILPVECAFPRFQGCFNAFIFRPVENDVKVS